MPKTTSTVPRFTIKKATKSKNPLAKLSIPTVPVEKLGDALGEAYQACVAQFKADKKTLPTSARGVFTLY